MSGFERDLRTIADRLELPQPGRTRVLLELAADLEDLEQALVAEGVPPEAARERALAMMLPAAEALEELEELHRPLYVRLVDRFSDPARHRLERMLLGVVAVGLFLASASWLSREQLFRDPAPFLWPLLGLGFLTLAVSAWKGFQLLVTKDHRPGQLRRGLMLLPALAVVAIVVGLGGVTVDLYHVAGRLEADYSNEAVQLLGWLRRDSAMLSVALLTCSIAGMLWLLIAAGVARVEQSEAELLAGIQDLSKGGES
jgi:hypothetical protein